VEQTHVPIGVIGGSGLYRLAASASSRAISTPYGDPSDSVAVSVIGEVEVAFLPRHGRGHTIPPHRINHRANIWALHALGVRRVIAPAAVGSLRVDMAPGDVVICDQFIDHTGSRHQTTFFDGPEVAHAAMADPYCAELRPMAADACRSAGFTTHDRGTVAVVTGPRFSTRAESRRFRADGSDVVNMTQFPEVALARELGLCYVNVSLVTDYDIGVDDLPEHAAVTQHEVMARFAEHTAALRAALEQLVARAGGERGCGCAGMRAVPLQGPLREQRVEHAGQENRQQ
jgi:5'-methylthioadenosine phosphorylase